MTDTKYFLAIDPASSTGYARFSLADGAITLNNYGIIEVKNIANEEFSTVGDTCNDLHDKIQSIDVPYVPVQKWFQLVVTIQKSKMNALSLILLKDILLR